MFWDIVSETRHERWLEPEIEKNMNCTQSVAEGKSIGDYSPVHLIFT